MPKPEFIKTLEDIESQLEIALKKGIKALTDEVYSMDNDWKEVPDPTKTRYKELIEIFSKLVDKLGE